jgi:hypothetical protein
MVPTNEFENRFETMGNDFWEKGQIKKCAYGIASEIV